jgi:L-threonylcarbamoyladenylate synthase
MKERFENDIIACLDVLSRGGLILYPTDTIWGIGCDATNADAVEKVYRLKKRPDQKALVTLVADEREILRYTASPDPLVFDYLEQTERPTTVIYDHALGVAENLPAPDGSIAIRICRDEFCRHLLRRFRKPIVSTSANISGEPAPKNFAAISEDIQRGVDYIVRHRQNDTMEAQPSTIVRWENGQPVLIR